MRQSLLLALFLALFSSSTFFSPAWAKKNQILPGPIPAVVEKVIDGDTVAVRADIWVGQSVRVLVRIDGVDTPEFSGKCQAERVAARSAKKFVARKVAGRPITLTNIRRGKYAGRVIAKITLRNGEDLGRTLLKTGHGQPYKKRKKNRWCCHNGKCPTNPTQFSKIKNYFRF